MVLDLNKAQIPYKPETSRNSFNLRELKISPPIMRREEGSFDTSGLEDVFSTGVKTLARTIFHPAGLTFLAVESNAGIPAMLGATFGDTARIAGYVSGLVYLTNATYDLIHQYL